MKPEAAESTEWFDIDATPLSDRAMRVDISWEKLRIPFTIEFATPALVWKQIDEAVANPAAPWSDFLMAARYAMETDTRPRRRGRAADAEGGRVVERDRAAGVRGQRAEGSGELEEVARSTSSRA